MKWHRLEATANSKPNIYGTKHLSLLTGRAVPEMMCSFNPGGGGGGVLLEFMGGDVPLGPWNP